jgi:hypothetical protein
MKGKMNRFDWPLNGRLITGYDAALLNYGDFQTLKNLRYTPVGIKGVRGMTKINTTAFTYPDIKNGFHFQKDRPVENHIIVQGNSGTNSRLVKNDGTVSIPAADDTFTAFQTLANNSTCYFSDAPDNCMVVCNTANNYVWGGDEYRCGGFINFDPDDTFKYNYTEQVNNTINNAANRAILHRVSGSGIDSDVALLLHLDNNTTDDGATGHTVTYFGYSTATVTDEPCLSITTWTDEDGAGGGESIQAVFDGKGTFRFDSKGTPGATWYARRLKDVGTIPDVFSVTISVYHSALGALAVDADNFRLQVDLTGVELDVAFGTDGIFVYDGAAYNEVGTNLVSTGGWQTWTFVVDGTTPASATCDVYLDDILQATGVDCSATGAFTNGNVAMTQYGTTTSDRISYVDFLKVGSGLDVAYSTTKVFGTHSAQLAGSTKHNVITIPDHADFDFSGGTFSIDFRFRLDNRTANQVLYYQGTDANNYFTVYIDTLGKVCVDLYDTGAQVLGASGLVTSALISTDTWYHVEVNENGDDWYIFINGIQRAYLSDTSRCADYTGPVLIGSDGATWFDGYIDEYRVSTVSRHTANYSIPLVAYSADNAIYVYVVSPRPIEGVKFYVATANTAAATATCYMWTGSWTSVSSLVDGTATSGKTLAKTGTISFTNTDGTAKVTVIDGLYGYYYQFRFIGIDDLTSLYYVTVDAPMQSLKDIWDGSPRSILAFWKHATTYTNLWSNVYKEEYDSTLTYTYADLGSLASTSDLYLGFAEKMTGFYFSLPDDSYVNTTADTIMTVEYWSGSAWTDVGTLQDGTSSNGISLNNSGTVTWEQTTDNTEFTTNVSNTAQFYYYRVSFTQNLDASVRLDYIYGLPAQKTIDAYRVPAIWQNRLWLFNDQNSDRNCGICSSASSVAIFNGADVTFQNGLDKMLFGNSGEILAASTLYTRYGSNVYDNLYVFKHNEIWMIDGTHPSNYTLYQVSHDKGITAPLTLKRCDIGYEMAPGVTKHVLIWQSETGIEMFDGNSIVCLTDDQGWFDSTSDSYIGTTNVSTYAADYDPVKKEYHWYTASREYVYDLQNRKWFEISRGASLIKRSWVTTDSEGNKFIYGGTSTGIVERLEYGTTFDGSSIVYQFKTGDLPLVKTELIETIIRKIKLIGRAKNTSTAEVSLTHYEDTKTTGESATYSLSQANASGRLYDVIRSVRWPGIMHALEYTVTTDNETVGFEPLIVSGWYNIEKEDVW